MDFKEIIILVQFVVIVLLLFGLYKSVPPEFVRLIIGFLERKAAETPEPEDDKFVAEVKRVVEGLLIAPKLAETTVNVNVPDTPAPGVG